MQSSCILICVLTHIAFITRIGACNPPINVAYAGRGYNILTGNPYTSGGFDRGFQKLVFNMNQCNSGKKWGIYDVPDGTSVVGVSTCVIDQQYNAMTGAQSYQSSLKQSVSVSGHENFGIEKAAFSANADYQYVNSQTSKAKSVSISSYAKCGVYEISLSTPYAGPPLDLNFYNAVYDMPLTYEENPDWFFNFIDQDFGTSYFAGLSFGGRYGQRTMFSSNSYSSFTSSNINIQQASSFSVLFVGGSESSLTASQVAHAKDFMQASYDQSTFFVGGDLPSDGSPKTWQQSLSAAPLPMYYHVESLDTLLVNSYFPNMSAADLTERQMALQSALKDYCRQFALNSSMMIECAGPPISPDLPLNSIFGGIYNPQNSNSSTVNAYTGEMNCPLDFEPVLMGWMFDAAGVEQRQYVCLNLTQKAGGDGMNYFGGFYQQCETDSGNHCTVPNYLTGGCSCPREFPAVAMVGVVINYVNDVCWNVNTHTGFSNMQYICYNPNTELSQSIIGGMYVLSSTSRTCAYEVPNVYTHSYSCPPGFEAHDTMEFCCYGVEKHTCYEWGMQKICLSNIYS